MRRIVISKGLQDALLADDLQVIWATTNMCFPSRLCLCVQSLTDGTSHRWSILPEYLERVYQASWPNTMTIATRQFPQAALQSVLTVCPSTFLFVLGHPHLQAVMTNLLKLLKEAYNALLADGLMIFLSYNTHICLQDSNLLLCLWMLTWLLSLADKWLRQSKQRTTFPLSARASNRQEEEEYSLQSSSRRVSRLPLSSLIKHRIHTHWQWWQDLKLSEAAPRVLSWWRIKWRLCSEPIIPNFPPWLSSYLHVRLLTFITNTRLNSGRSTTW